MRFALAAFSAVALASLAGCGEAAPVTPDGAVHLELVQNDATKCMIFNHNADVGAIDGQNRSMIVENGTSADGGPSATKVACNVSGTSTYNVHGVLDDTAGPTNVYFEMLIGSITPGASETSPATGSAVFTAPWTAGQPYSGACNFWFTPQTKETVNNTGGAGRVWVTFSCDALTSGMSTCPISVGYAIFENCLTTPASSM